ncbi:MAG: sigma-70 family RNA polymerase sigma factor, partial [Actinomycetota bacterium]
DDIEETEQSALAVVAVKVGQYRHTARFTTWLHQVASNEAKMLIRARDRRPSSAVEEPPVAPFVARLSTMLADRDVIERAFSTLPDDFRRALELREIDGLDYEEIAADLDVPVGTVRSRLSRGRALLVERLRDELTDASVAADDLDDADTAT